MAMTGAMLDQTLSQLTRDERYILRQLAVSPRHRWVFAGALVRTARLLERRGWVSQERELACTVQYRLTDVGLVVAQGVLDLSGALCALGSRTW